MKLFTTNRICAIIASLVFRLGENETSVCFRCVAEPISHGSTADPYPRHQFHFANNQQQKQYQMRNRRVNMLNSSTQKEPEAVLEQCSVNNESAIPDVEDCSTGHVPHKGERELIVPDFNSMFKYMFKCSQWRIPFCLRSIDCS